MTWRWWWWSTTATPQPAAVPDALPAPVDAQTWTVTAPAAATAEAPPAALQEPAGVRIERLAKLVTAYLEEKQELQRQLVAANRRIDYQARQLDQARAERAMPPGLLDGRAPVTGDTWLRAELARSRTTLQIMEQRLAWWEGRPTRLTCPRECCAQAQLAQVAAAVGGSDGD